MSNYFCKIEIVEKYFFHILITMIKENIKSSVMPQGFLCASRLCGLKKSGKDLTVIYSKKPASAAAVFTKNTICGVPVALGREIIKKETLQALVINSKISNVGTGELGMQNAKKMAIATAKELAIDPSLVLMSSTGIIAQQLPIEKIQRGIIGISQEFCSNPLVAAEGIMTTDTYPKAICAKVGKATITIIGKGSGMVEPDMATMLVYILTDAQIDAKKLDLMLRRCVDKSFNMLSIDSDMSTSDTCVIMANSMAGEGDLVEFEQILQKLCIQMTEMLARDGEGATKLLRVFIKNALNEKEAKIFAKSVVNSPLIKTMVHGGDPNIGRLLMALGKCTENTLDIEKLSLAINDIIVFDNSNKVCFNEQKLRKKFDSQEVDIMVNLNLGNGCATAYGCDLTNGYIQENAAYYSS